MFRKVYFRFDSFKKVVFGDNAFRKIFFKFIPASVKKVYFGNILGGFGYGYNYGTNYGGGL